MIEKLPAGRLFAKSLPALGDREAWLASGRTENDLIERLTLSRHLDDVYQAAKRLLATTGRSQLLAVGLLPDEWLSRLERVVLLAAAIHDLGKGGDHFQKFIRKPYGPDAARQPLRHEWVTLLTLDAGWGKWIRAAVASDDEWELVRWAVSGHHPKYGRMAPPEVGQGSPTLDLQLTHPDFDAIVAWLAGTFELPGTPPRKAEKHSLLIYDDGNAVEPLHDAYFESLARFDGMTSEWRRFAAVAKNCLIAADVAGSAIPSVNAIHGTLDWTWIDATLGADSLPTSEFYEAIVVHRLKKGELRPFQSAVGASSARVTLARAGCGSGKTLAAYEWARRRCDGRRLFVCYPTTGTGTEGFRDYLVDPGLFAAFETPDEKKRWTRLVHSRSDVDYELLMSDADRADAIARLESLQEVWSSPIVACTVDCVLGLIQNNKRGLYGWPALSQAGFVFDEIHSYDARLFSALLHFLEHVRGVPVLLMTASLQAYRLAAIEEVLSRIDEKLAVVPGPENLETLPRYLSPEDVTPKSGRKKAFELVQSELGRGGRVLVVANTVGRAMRLASEELADMPVRPELYHSRFKYEDRVARHRAVVDKFKQVEKAALAVCTQVAEMSLDLSATLLVTELAPVPALIQRLGRLNRKAEPREDGSPSEEPKRFLILDPLSDDDKGRSALPYGDDELTRAEEWLKQLRERHGDGPLSQRDLAEAWEELDVGGEVERWASAWLDYGPANPVHELREGSPNVTVLMQEDYENLGRHPSSAQIARLSLPMPARPDRIKGATWRLERDGEPVVVRGVAVAKREAIAYDPQRGAEWRWD